MEKEWLPQDVAATKEFLNSNTGRKLISRLYDAAPKASGGSFEEEALNYRLLKGVVLAIESLLNHGEDRQAETPTGKFYNPMDYETAP